MVGVRRIELDGGVRKSTLTMVAGRGGVDGGWVQGYNSPNAES